MNKCVFLDRDGVINKERGEYTYRIEDFYVDDELINELHKLKAKGYLLIIITNQGGINKGLYTSEDVFLCHDYFQKLSNNVIDDVFYSPYHDNYTKSLARKPNSLMFERAMYKWNVKPENCWMIGDSSRDITSAGKVGINSIYIGTNKNDKAEQSFESPAQALKFIYNSII